MDVVREETQGCCDRKGCEGEGEMETDDPLWRPLKETAKRSSSCQLYSTQDARVCMRGDALTSELESRSWCSCKSQQYTVMTLTVS